MTYDPYRPCDEGRCGHGLHEGARWTQDVMCEEEPYNGYPLISHRALVYLPDYEDGEEE